jgi:hypothetical protein
MTDIEAKALALVNEIERERGETELTPRIMRGLIMDEALCRALEQHEAFKQEVSKVMTYIKALYPTLPTDYDRFIIPKPKPDPLVAAVHEARYAIRGLLDIASEENLDSEQAGRAYAALHEIGTALAALEARGLEIREKGQ